MESGLIQIYTGHGKGKTTAALGQAMRAVGRNLKVIMIHFLKADETGEIACINNYISDLKVYRCSSQTKCIWEMNDDELAILKNDTILGFNRAKKIVNENACDMLILDEAIGAVNRGFISCDDMKNLMLSKPGTMELILTGRDADQNLIELADLVTEMKKVKHPFDKGICSRIGIER